MQIAELPNLPPIGTNAYLAMDDEGKEALLFDAPGSVWSLIEPELKRRGCPLVGLLLTHGHFDHICDVAAIAAQGVPVYGHRDDLFLLRNPGPQTALFIEGLEIPPGDLDHCVEHGQTLELLGETIEVRHAPGHSPGSVIYYVPASGLAVSGDTIFAGGWGRTDLPGADDATLRQTFLEQIYTLPEETVLLPGHGPPTTVGKEKASNPFAVA